MPSCEVVREVEEGVEQVESRNPQALGRKERPRLPRRLPGHREPGTERREARTRAEPEVAEPRHALQVRVDDEHRDRNRPEPADDRLELKRRDQVQREGGGAEGPNLGRGERPGGDLAARRARVSSVELRIDEPVQAHGERPSTHHREGQPDRRADARESVDGEERADVREREREDGVLELDERGKAPRERERRRAHVWRCREL